MWRIGRLCAFGDFWGRQKLVCVPAAFVGALYLSKLQSDNFSKTRPALWPERHICCQEATVGRCWPNLTRTCWQPMLGGDIVGVQDPF